MKIEQLQRTLPDGCAFLVKNPINRFYLTGFSSSAGTLVITENRRVLIVDFRYYEMAKKTVTCCDVQLMTRELQDLIPLLENVEKVYVETDFLPVSRFRAYGKALTNVEFSRSDRLVRELSALRLIKEESEIAKIRACQEITDAAFSYILTRIRPGMKETEVAFELDMFIRRQGAPGNSFSTIAVSGPNTSLPHGVPGKREICSGDFVLMDFGVYLDGYCSDMTRTVGVSHVSDKQRHVYETVRQAQEKALSVIKPGIACGKVDQAARDWIEIENGFAGCFGHSLGHGVGAEIHEQPVFAPNNAVDLKKGMVITVEPGIYLEGEFGVRIEDFVVITDDGYENFTHSPHELIIL